VSGLYGIASWNDGQGFNAGRPYAIQGLAYTTDGGATCTDAGRLPNAGSAGCTIYEWFGDPVVTVNRATGEFYVAGLITLPPLSGVNSTHNGLGILSVTFPGGVFTWGTPHVIRDVADATNFLDKEWIACDPATGALYVTYTDFNS